MVIARHPTWPDLPDGAAWDGLRVLVLTDIVDSTRENDRVGDAAMAEVQAVIDTAKSGKA